MLINLRNALMTGKRLPFDAEVEYLESTGTQWIDSGVIADDDVGVKMHVVSANRPLSTRLFFGVFGSNNRFGFGWNDIGQLFLWWNEATSISYTGTIIQDSDVALNYYNSRSWNIGTVASGNITSAYNSSNTEIRVLTGKRMDNGENVFSPFGLKFGAIQITKGNTLVRDFIPVRKGTVGYLYDRVSGKLFGNAGTGDFVLGPDVVPVEYIESHGTEWIDTGYSFTTKTHEWRVTASDISLPSGATAAAWLFGSYYPPATNMMRSGGLALQTNGTKLGVGIGDIGAGATTFTLPNPSQKKTLSVVSRPDDFSISDGVNTLSGTYNGTSVTGLHECLYCLNNTGGVTHQVCMKAYGAQMYELGELVRSFHPIRVGTDATSWEGAMMDVLTRRIYRNAGTGAFGYGNDLKYPIPAS